MIDYTDLLGVKFAYGGRGPDEYDCYGLLIELHRRQGVEIPDYNSPSDQQLIHDLMDREKSRWVSHEFKGQTGIDRSAFKPGRVLLFRVGRHVSHVGLIIDPRYFLHIWEGSGQVVRERISSWHHRIMGVYSFDDRTSPGSERVF